MSKVHFSALTDYTFGSVEELQALLDKIGVKMIVTEEPQNPTYSRVEFEYDPVAVDRRAISRNAGRKSRVDGFNHLTLAEYRERVANGQTITQIAEYVGLNRSTFYHRVKAAEKLPGNDDSLKIVVS